MRAHVEIDTAVGSVCLDTGQRLKSEWEGVWNIQISVFAQEALYMSPGAETPEENFELLKSTLTREGISVVGSAPWVGPSRELAHKNMAHILKLAQDYNLHADFHLDYNLDMNAKPMVWKILRQMREVGWTKASAGNRRVTIGHATRRGMFSAEERSALRKQLGELPSEIVAFPQSNMYMMGRRSPDGSRSVPLAGRTLDAGRIWRDHGIHIALSVNNVENALTPQGYFDPLTLACLGVRLFQIELSWNGGFHPYTDVSVYQRSVSTTPKETIGIVDESDNLTKSADSRLVPRVGGPADSVVVHEVKR
ncbi:hypothetical protein PAXRUDRAFT_767458 [Paxillus rubicundulus Ve08.2h10]|uniref:Unplaced genomic scaffold scaffold_132, whole genome shotgun sequence n=1 Tax=Paxillus rubicundulus Ve08.2h10 TaxID=930991 RepID=A0A0D0EB26_9AGAM|nr:hypothetical protein PAXRUDRAFT_767458 [Paxillus rubicundulus Ve08.2h10]